ncbi:helix-turn-helix domain-containing protein [Streptomyces sediminimaris]|uniref:helix-turn-helix domain-containing protein n=1 Tax=Streptomyces sediminimaris TaxID=3383721 RepID=UPI00399BE431
MSGRAPECARLAEALRELRGRTELSLAALAGRTAFSKSSWERYLNGRTLPPRSAVEALCRVADVPATRYVALWELAEAAWSGRGARPGPARAQPGPAGGRAGSAGGRAGSAKETAGSAAEPAGAGNESAGLAGDRGRPSAEASGPSWWRRPPVIAAAGAGAVVCALAAVLTVAHRPADERGSPPAPEVSRTTRQVLCHGAGCTGRPPLSSGCGDVEVQGAPKVLRTVRSAGVEIQIRYKPECGAAWVRVSGQHVGDRFEVTAPGVAAQRMVIADRYATGILRSSPMVAVRAGKTKEVEACADLAGSGGWKCFRP